MRMQSERRNIIPATIAVATLAVLLAVALPAAADQMSKDSLKSVQGEVVMLTPVTLQLGVDGRIEDFEVNTESEIPAGVNAGEWVTIWYTEEPSGKITVSTMERSQQPAEQSSTSGTSATESGSESSGTMSGNGSSTESATRSTGSSSSMSGSEGTRQGDTGSAMTDTGSSQTGTSGGSEAYQLPQTASAQPALLIAGLMMLTLAGGLALLRRS